MSQINVSHLSFYYDGSYDMIFDDVSFVIDTDWKLGFVGRNGRGKTTFLNLLLGKYEYRGKITSNMEFDYFPFSVASPRRDTVDVIEELYPQYELWKVLRELTLLSVGAEVLYRPFDTLSNGEQTKVLLALLFSKEHKFLLIDEPTNHLDLEARVSISEYLRKKKGFILVSHDRAFLDSCIDHVLAINKTGMEVVQGNFTTWWENKKLRDAYEEGENEKLKKDIGRLKEAAKRSAQWSDAVEKTKIGTRVGGLRPDRGHIGHKAAKMMKRAKVTEARMDRAVEEKSKLLKNVETAETLKIMPLNHHKKELVRIHDASLCYGEKKVVDRLRMTIRTGDKVALQGKNGSGKSTILKAVLSAAGEKEVGKWTEPGQLRVGEGLIELAGGLLISYVPQDTGGLGGDLKSFAIRWGLDEALFKALLRKLDFSREQFEKRIEDYSAGQKKKILIAKSLCERAHLYLWDEPLNYIDIFSRMQIEELVGTYNLTLLFVEHDRSFAEAIGADVICLDGGGGDQITHE